MRRRLQVPTPSHFALTHRHTVTVPDPAQKAPLLVTVDCGARYVAMALFNLLPPRLLVAAFRVEAHTRSSDHAARLQVATATRLKAAAAMHAVVEMPRKYDEDKHERERDVLRVVAMAGAVSVMLAAGGTQVETVAPPEWKGQLPKDVHHPRVWGALVKESKEAEVLRPHAKDMDVLDAVAIGLWRLGRLR